MNKKMAACIPYVGLLILTVATYWPVTGCDFIGYDDRLYVTSNAHVQSGLTMGGVRWVFTSTECSNWHPLTWLSHMVDCQLFGLDPHAHHAVNLGFHAVNTLLLLLILLRLTGMLWHSAFVAALFALHPLHVESVAWIAERKDVLSTCFAFLTILAYTSYTRKRTPWKYLLVLLLFALGLLAKPMLVTIPLLLLLLDFWPLKRFPFQTQTSVDAANGRALPVSSLVMEKVPLLAFALASSIVTIWVQHRGGSIRSFEFESLSARVANAAQSYLVYLWKMFWPTDLAIFYPYEAVPFFNALAAGAVLVSITWFALAKFRTLPYLFVGWFWFLVTLLPVIGLVQVGQQAFADRYSYLPLIGIFIAVAWGSAEIINYFNWPRFIPGIIGATLVLMCALTTRHELTYWKNGVTLFSRAVQVTSNNYEAECSLAESLIVDGRIKEAMQHAREGIKIQPTVQLYLLLAATDLKSGDRSEAVHCYREILGTEPDERDSLNNLAWLLATDPDDRIRNGAEAVEYAEKACQLSAYKQPLYIGTLAAAYAEAGRFPDAIAAAEQACDAAAANGNAALLKKNQELLQLYRSGHAFRKP